MKAPEVVASDETPWVETSAGGLFFINAILAAPVMMVLLPWTLRWVLRVSGALNRPSRVLDPIPAVADHVLPIVGWLALPAAWLVWKALGVVELRWARRLLWLFLALHLGTVGFTVASLLG